MLLLSPRSVKGCGGSNGGGLSGTRRRRASAGVVLERASQHRRAWGATVVQTWVCRCVCVCVGQSGRSGEGLAGAGRRAGRGPGCAVRGVPSEKGGRCEGADREVGKRGLTLSLSLRFVFSTLFCRRCALHLAPGAICASAVVGSTLADSDSVSYTPSPAPVGCSADPASLTAAPKGPLLGGLPIVSGLEGVW